MAEKSDAGRAERPQTPDKKPNAKPDLGRLVDSSTGRAVDACDVVKAAREHTAAVRRQAADMMFAFDDGSVVSAADILFGDE